MEFLSNPIIISVLVLCGMCLARVNVLVSLIVSALVAGFFGNLGLTQSMNLLAEGFSANATTALSYILLGTFAVAIANTGLMEMLVRLIGHQLGNKPKTFTFSLAAIACLSQNIVPVHIAFIPLLIPPLLKLMNKMKLDRRAVATALGFGLTAPYISLPIGFGLIFQGIVADSMSNNGMTTSISDVASVAWIGGTAMLIGLTIAVLFFTSRPRTYQDKPIFGSQAVQEQDLTFARKHWMTLLSIVAAVAVQVYLQSLPLAALMGLTVMMFTGVFNFDKLDTHIASGISMMGFIAFVMLIAGGYATILKETNAVSALIEGVVPFIGDNKWLAAILISLIGLLITMGIGTSFGTVPILAVIYVPLCSAVGFSVPATILLMVIAGALGDAGSPASDSTLGPTCGLNSDGQHNHIWDTCVPTFLTYNLSLMAAGVIVSQFI